jgi:hypothetical protein
MILESGQVDRGIAFDAIDRASGGVRRIGFRSGQGRYRRMLVQIGKGVD